MSNSVDQLGAAHNRNEARRRRVDGNWRCFGPVHGACGKLHRTRSNAAAHCRDYSKSARGASSDRQPQKALRDERTATPAKGIRVSVSDFAQLSPAQLWARIVGPLSPQAFAEASPVAAGSSPLSACVSAVDSAVNSGVLLLDKPWVGGRISAALATHLARCQWASLTRSAQGHGYAVHVDDAIVYRRDGCGVPEAWLQLGAGRVELHEAGLSVLVPLREWTVDEALACLSC